ncbi:MAG: HEAT repeat domain-containing protein [Gammaproteobacteria bacterium]|nr:HEAT repeat domain-containing protein [Pseudomonadales bacterium]MCP5348045.1 HEAT repeat domain-containing protein [Pseudomonadales bacterium]
MNIPENERQLEDLVLRYLYDDLDSGQRTAFEHELTVNRQLKKLLEREQSLELSIPRGTSVYIDDERLGDNRRQVRRQLQRQVAKRPLLTEFLAALVRRPALAVLQTAVLAVSFALGFVIAGPGTSITTPVSSGTEVAARMSPLGLVGEQDYEIANLQIERFDPASGDIELSFALASDTHLSGNISEAGIRTLMTVALVNEIDEAARLDTLDVLQKASYDDQVSASMIYVLNNDENPGVRYAAVRSLVEFVEDEQVKSALRQALGRDVNPGVRVEAFNALAENPDPETLAVFRQRAESDGNDYIRQQARAILENTDPNSNAGFSNSAIF